MSDKDNIGRKGNATENDLAKINDLALLINIGNDSGSFGIDKGNLADVVEHENNNRRPTEVNDGRKRNSSRATEVNDGEKRNSSRATEVNDGRKRNGSRATEVNVGEKRNSGRATEVNDGRKRNGSRATEVNVGEKRNSSRPTEVKDGAERNSRRSTEINPQQAVQTAGEIPVGGPSSYNLAVGEILRGEEGRVYEILERIDKESGEAVVYRAKDQTGNREYAIKVYKREDAIKEEIVETLKKIDSPYLPKLYEVGKIGSYPYEVMEFYSEGSMEGKKLTLKELKENFIPSMNAALQVLDEHQIVHQDIKPANVMKKGKSYVLMDFGISGVRKEGKSYVSRVGGFSTDYLPPWDLAASYVTSKWDYYSLGITIYELITGHLPYAGMDPQERMRMNTKSDSELAAVLNTLEVPEEFKTLLHGLSRSLPYTRWAQAQVQCWLEGRPVEENTMPESAQKLITGYDFEKVTYQDVDELMEALAKNWEKGKGHLFHGYIQEHMKNNQRYDLANTSADAAESQDDHDLVFANWLYTMSDRFERLYWKQNSWTLLEFGKEILSKLWECADVYTKDKKKGFEEIKEFLRTDVLILFCNSQRSVSKEHEEVATRVQRHVERLRNLNDYGQSFFRELYGLAYTLTRKPVLLILGMKFDSYPAFMEYVESLYRDAGKEEELKKLLNKLGIRKGRLADNDALELQFSCWLRAVRENAENQKTGNEA